MNAYDKLDDELSWVREKVKALRDETKTKLLLRCVWFTEYDIDNEIGQGLSFKHF